MINTNISDSLDIQIFYLHFTDFCQNCLIASKVNVIVQIFQNIDRVSSFSISKFSSIGVWLIKRKKHQFLFRFSLLNFWIFPIQKIIHSVENTEDQSIIHLFAFNFRSSEHSCELWMEQKREIIFDRKWIQVLSQRYREWTSVLVLRQKPNSQVCNIWTFNH